jgi:hypothetical protein
MYNTRCIQEINGKRNARPKLQIIAEGNKTSKGKKKKTGVLNADFIILLTGIITNGVCESAGDTTLNLELRALGCQATLQISTKTH